MNFQKRKGNKDMMYSEFLQGTGCKENGHNYKVYLNLEIMYMNSNMSKEEIYEYGKKLVDNSKSVSELALERQVKEIIEDAYRVIDYCKNRIKFAETMLILPLNTEDTEFWKKMVEENRKRIKTYRLKIRTYKNFI